MRVSARFDMESETVSIHYETEYGEYLFHFTGNCNIILRNLMIDDSWFISHRLKNNVVLHPALILGILLDNLLVCFFISKMIKIWFTRNIRKTSSKCKAKLNLMNIVEKRKLT